MLLVNVTVFVKMSSLRGKEEVLLLGMAFSAEFQRSLRLGKNFEIVYVVRPSNASVTQSKLWTISIRTTYYTGNIAEPTSLKLGDC